MTRLSLAKPAIVVVSLVLVGYGVFVATHHIGGGRHPPSGGEPHPTIQPSRRPSVFPPPGQVFLGLNTSQGSYDFGPVDAFSSATGYRPSVLQFAQGWAVHKFDRSVFDRVASRGMLPILSWEPWDYQETGPAQDHGDQPKYRLANIINGQFDDYIRTWTEGIAGLGYPIAIRFAHEMNGFWYPWCEQSNGNHPGDYVKVWRHIRDIFTKAGADHVIWIWSPNVSYPGSTALDELYPGDQYVDWIGLSGYYGTPGVEHYKSFNNIFDKTFDELSRFTRKPIVVTETGATDSSGLRATWIRQMFQELPAHPYVIGVIWFEAVKELDWRVVASPAAVAAYAKGAAAPRYHVSWSPNTVPASQAPAP